MTIHDRPGFFARVLLQLAPVNKHNQQAFQTRRISNKAIMKPYPFRRLALPAAFISCLFFSCTKTNDKQVPVDQPPVQGAPAPSNVIVSSIAGKEGDHGNAEDGNGGNARFWNPTKMVFDGRNNMLYVADGTTIRSVDQANNVKTYMPLGTISRFNEILDIDLAPGPDGGTLYFISKENDIWKITPSGDSFAATSIVNRVYGGNEAGALNTADHIDGPTGITTGKNGEIYFFNSFWNTLHKVNVQSWSPVTGTVSGFAGKPPATRSGNAWPFSDGAGEQASFGGSVADIASDKNGNIYIADFRNDLVRMVTPDGIVSSLFKFMDGLGIDKDGPVNTAQANRVTQVSPSQDGSKLFFTTFGTGGNYTPALRMVKPGETVSTLVNSGTKYGDGDGNTAGFSTIGGIAATPDGATIYVSEPGKKIIRKVVIR